MRTVTFKSILDYVATKMVGQPALMGVEEASSYGTAINFHVRECWERNFWPEWTPIEERVPAGSDPKVVSLDQVDETPIGTVKRITAADPLVTLNAAELRWRPGTDGIELAPEAGDRVWIEFRKRPPEFTTVPWDPEASYAEGDLVYYAGGTYVAGTVTPVARLTVTGAARIFGLSPNGTYLRSAVASHGKPAYLMAESNLAIYYNGTGWETGVFIAPATVGALSGDDSSTTGWHNTTGSSDPSTAVAAYTAFNGGPGDIQGVPTVVLSDAFSNPVDDTDGWTLVEFPYVLANAVKLLAYADALDDDGQEDKATVQRERGEEALAVEWSKADAQQGMVRTFAVRTRPAPRACLNTSTH